MKMKTRMTKSQFHRKISIENSYRLITDVDYPSLCEIMEMDDQVEFDELLFVVFEKLLSLDNIIYLYDYVAIKVDKASRVKLNIPPLLAQIMALDKCISVDFRYMLSDLYFECTNSMELVGVEFNESGKFLCFDFEVTN